MAQEKYLIFFTDKGFNDNSGANVIREKFLLAKKNLSEKCLERRAKTKTAKLIDDYDIPVDSAYVNALHKDGVSIIHRLDWFNAVSAKLNPSEVKRILRFPFVKNIRKVRTFYFAKNRNYSGLEMLKSFPLTSGEHKLNYGPSLEQLELSDIPALHDLGLNGKGILIGLMDTGFRWESLDIFKNIKIAGEHDFVFNDDVTANQDGDRYDQDEHGTEILSIIGGFSPGDLIGSAYGAKFVLAKTEDVRSETHVEEDNYAAALEWFEKLGVDISSSSLGYNQFDSSTYSYTYSDMNGKTTIVTRAAEIAFQKGMLVITAAGNEAGNSWHYIIAPADGFNTIAVGALRSDGTVAYFSSRGPTSDGRIKPDVSALGVNVHVIDPYGYGFRNVSGTSASTPIVAGAAALILQAFPYLSNIQLRKILLESGSIAANPNDDIGYGKLSALKALTYPNIRRTGDSIFVNKYFYYPGNSLTSLPKMFVSNDGGEFKEIEGRKIRDGFYSFYLSNNFTNDSLNFYFYYSLSNGSDVKEPEKDFYTYKYGTEIISHYTHNVIYRFAPKKFFVSANYPNPFNSQTKIEYELPYDSKVEISVCDVLGRKVKTVENKFLTSGYYTATINMAGYSSGVYFVLFKTGKEVKVQKIVLIK